MLVVKVKDKRVYAFPAGSIVVSNISVRTATILVTAAPGIEREFVVSYELVYNNCREYGNSPSTSEAIARYLADGFRRGMIEVDAEAEL